MMNQQHALKELRKRLNLSQPQFAQMLNRSPGLIGQYEAVLPKDLAGKIGDIAGQAGHQDLAVIFRALADSDFSESTNQYLSEQQTPGTPRPEGANICAVPNAQSVRDGTQEATLVSHQTRSDYIKYHRWLDEILGSGIPRYVAGIAANLELGHLATQSKRGDLEQGARDIKAANETGQTAKQQPQPEPQISETEKAIRAEIRPKRRNRKRPA